MLVGISAGYWLMGSLDEALFKPLLGGVILGMVVLDLALRLLKVKMHRLALPLSIGLGLLAGLFTMLANAAGPVMTIYLLSLGLSKDEFLGTGAVFYCVVNLIKLPLSLSLGLVTAQSAGFDLLLLPAILAGCGVGLWASKRISQGAFDLTARLLAAVGGIKLLF